MFLNPKASANVLNITILIAVIHLATILNMS